MIIRMASFVGEAPRIHPRLLQDNWAQAAYNTKLENGALTPIRTARFVTSLDEDAQTIYKHGDDWITFTGVVNVARAPVAEDRLYITGDGAPKLMVGGETVDLAVPYPRAALTATSTLR